MPGGRLTCSALCGALLFSLFLPASRAHGDVYHAVAAGETLSGVANKYHVSADALRSANGLREADSVPLGAMLLRVPGVNDSSAAPLSTGNASWNSGFGTSALAPSASAPNGSSGSMTGTIGKTMLETVRLADTWETIAARYRAAGHDVTAQALRRRNGFDLPAPGQNVVVPLNQVSYAAPVANAFAPRPAPRVQPSITATAQTVPAKNTAPRALNGGVLASGEIDMSFVRDNTPTQPPVYSAPSIPDASARSPLRRGSSLPSRSGYGQLSRQALGADVRVLRPDEEATAPPAPNTARVTTNQAAARVNSLARVARVAGSGARIRRLPQSSAVTLYKCAVGTQLAVLRQSGIWSAVLMSDRSTGWLPSKYLAMTAQTIDVSAQIVSSDPGGQVNGFAGNYAGENPMVAQALRWLGTPYRYGGTSRRGIDCSSLVQHAFAACGYSLPRTAAQQATVGAAVVPAQLRAGDRLYFSASGTRIDHTGLYMGDGLFVHASGSGRQVMVSNLFTPRNWNIFVGARR